DAVGLDEVRQQVGLLQHAHGTDHTEIADAHGAAVIGEAHHAAVDACLQVLQVGGQAQHRHDLGGDDDVEAVLAGHALGGAAQADRDLPQCAVVDVHHPLPLHPSRIDVQGVALMDVVVHEVGQRVVR